MKNIIALLSVAILATALLALAADDAKPVLRPTQKLMQARKSWLASMNANLKTKQFEAVVKDADDLSAQTKQVADSQTNPLGKELDMAISSLAKEISVAAVNQDSDTVKAKLGTIREKCSECHTKIRDRQ